MKTRPEGLEAGATPLLGPTPMVSKERTNRPTTRLYSLEVEAKDPGVREQMVDL